MRSALLHYGVGAALLGVVLWQVDRDKLLVYADRLDPAVLLGIALLLVAFHLLKTLRWQAILAGQEVSYGFGETLRMYWSGLFMGVVTPGRLGDLVRVVHLRQDGISGGRAMVGIVADRGLDLGVLAVLLATGLAWWVWGGEAPAATALALVAVARGGTPGAAGRRLAAGLRGLDPGRLVGSGWLDFKADLRDLLRSRRNFGRIIGITALAWAMYVWGVHALVHSVGLQFPLGLTLLFFSVAGVVSLVPLSVAGIGTRDVALVALAEFTGFDAEAGLVFSFVMLLLHLLTAVVGAAGWGKARRLRRQLRLERVDDVVA